MLDKVLGAMARRPIRLLHTSDVHLGPAGYEPQGRAHVSECVCPIHILGHLVEEHDVDVVIVAGDLFDHARVSSQLVFDTFDRLGEIRADVALLPGNHDVFDETALYRRHRDALAASGVYFFDDPNGSAFDLAGGALRIWARAMEDHYPGYQPLRYPPAHPGDRWFVVAGHGHFTPDAEDNYRSSPITVADIDATGADYVALGHWHVTTDLMARGASTPAWYPGASLFGHGAGQMLLVDLAPDEPVRVRTLSVLDHPASMCRPSA